MSDDIPCEIQEEILKRLPIKSLLHFRSVSKAWKSLIESSAFIAEYKHTELQQRILVRYDFEQKYVSVADDDTFSHQRLSLTVPKSVVLLYRPAINGCSQGLFCFYDNFQNQSDSGKNAAIIWNPAIRKSIAIDVSDVLDGVRYTTLVRFGVCPHTLDPMLLNISIECFPGKNNTFTETTWRVEIFRLSVGSWKSLSINLPRRTVVSYQENAQVVIDRFIYWLAFDKISRSNLIISFDMVSEVFAEIPLPDNLALSPYLYSDLYLRKFNGSLAVIEDISDVDVSEYGVWVMENGDPNSFVKLYTIKKNKADRSIVSVLGFRKSGEPLVRMRTKEEDYELFVYNPNSEHIYYGGISAKEPSFFVSHYTETLLLLDH